MKHKLNAIVKAYSNTTLNKYEFFSLNVQSHSLIQSVAVSSSLKHFTALEMKKILRKMPANQGAISGLH